jgi:hypothetical protein
MGDENAKGETPSLAGKSGVPVVLTIGKWRRL